MRPDKKIILELNKPQGIIKTPFVPLARKTGLSQERLLARIREYKARRVMRRFGIVLAHRKVGLGTNALVVWNVPRRRAAVLGRFLAQEPAVSHCYERTRAPGWPYNVYSMVHARSKRACLALVRRIARAAGAGDHAVLFSLKELKKKKMDLQGVFS